MEPVGEIECEFCKKLVSNLFHVLECELATSWLFNGATLLTWAEGSSMTLQTRTRRPNAPAVSRWKTILEIREEMLKLCSLPPEGLYA